MMTIEELSSITDEDKNVLAKHQGYEFVGHKYCNPHWSRIYESHYCAFIKVRGMHTTYIVKYAEHSGNHNYPATEEEIKSSPLVVKYGIKHFSSSTDLRGWKFHWKSNNERSYWHYREYRPFISKYSAASTLEEAIRTCKSMVEITEAKISFDRIVERKMEVDDIGSNVNLFGEDLSFLPSHSTASPSTIHFSHILVLNSDTNLHRRFLLRSCNKREIDISLDYEKIEDVCKEILYGKVEEKQDTSVMFLAERNKKIYVGINQYPTQGYYGLMSLLNFKCDYYKPVK